jgi:hypothetical protein
MFINLFFTIRGATYKGVINLAAPCSVLNYFLCYWNHHCLTSWKYVKYIQFNSFIFLHKQVKIMSQHNDKNYIDGEKRAYRTSEQLTETHSRRNWQKAPILPATRRTEALC